MPTNHIPNIDELSNFIRQIDGNHRLGAGALAERICTWLAETAKSLAQQQDAEPVAMYMGHRHTPADTTEFWGFSENRMAKGTSLYTHPAPKHTPLTDEQIDAITISQWGDMRGFPLAAHRAYARAVEAAHGIKGETK